MQAFNSSHYLPPWKDFRPRYPDETDTDYRLAMGEFNDAQHRTRDHWIVNQIGALLGQQELLRDDLMGDGTTLHPGILRTIITEQKQTPQKIKEAIREDVMTHQAKQWLGAKRWVWGVVAGSLVATVSSVTLAIFTSIHH